MIKTIYVLRNSPPFYRLRLDSHLAGKPSTNLDPECLFPWRLDNTYLLENHPFLIIFVTSFTYSVSPECSISYDLLQGPPLSLGGVSIPNCDANGEDTLTGPLYATVRGCHLSPALLSSCTKCTHLSFLHSCSSLFSPPQVV
ncbi:hypothetical protein AMECASPLE_022148 [Ameca splendens]|uniref:Uncharacterized protein n=1 Tax=Ameca splendens TaxID=208324 RepID=A0ABV0Y3U5_9TELE